MENKNASGPIPEGWEVKPEQQKDGSEIPCYWCPRSGQHFSTYTDMMRYVNYAMEHQLSIYSPDFQARKLRKKAKRSHKGNRTTIAPRRRSHFFGETSKTVPSYRVTSFEESSNSEERTTLSNPEDSTEATQYSSREEHGSWWPGAAGVSKEAEMLSSDLEALVIRIEKLSLC